MGEEQQNKALENCTEVIGVQNTLIGGKLELRQYKNLEAKRKVKEEVLKRFNNELFRSIIKPREIDRNIRFDKLDRLGRKDNGRKDNLSDVEVTIRRADSFGAKKKETISTFPSVLTFAYCMLLSEEGDKVLDLFMGHNSRASDVLACGRKYYGFDVHKFPYDFTKQCVVDYPSCDYELNLCSSEKIDYPDNSFDFSMTCPPYANVENYCKIYEEEVDNDLSSKDYGDFLKVYKKCLGEGYRVLKPNKYFVIVVGNFFKNKKMTNFMGDTIFICERLGFVLHDINIYDRCSNIGFELNFKLFLKELKRFGQIHEYILVFKKVVFKKEVVNNEFN